MILDHGLEDWNRQEMGRIITKLAKENKRLRDRVGTLKGFEHSGMSHRMQRRYGQMRHATGKLLPELVAKTMQFAQQDDWNREEFFTREELKLIDDAEFLPDWKLDEQKWCCMFCMREAS